MSAAGVIGPDRQAEQLLHFLTQHVPPDLIVVPVDWLPRNGRHWYLFPDVDALALSTEAWESGQAHAIFEEEGIRLRLPNPGERPPGRERCPGCPPRPQGTSDSRPRDVRARRPTVNDLGLLQHR